MADSPISTFPAISGAGVTGSEKTVVVSSGVDKSMTLTEFLAGMKHLGISLVDLSNVTAPAPSANDVLLYNGTGWINSVMNATQVVVDSTSILNSASTTAQGTLVDLDAAITSAAGTGIPATLFDAAGDLLVGTADNTGAKLTKGSNYTALSVNGSGTVGYNDPRTFPQLTNTQTGTTYTHVLADSGKLVTLNNSSSITLTVDTNANVATPIDTAIDLVQLGAGQVTVVGGSGVTVNTASSLKLRTQFSGASLIKTATDTWTLVGDLEPLGQAINAQTGTTYTFVYSDAEKLVTMTNASAQTYTVPPNSSVAFPIGIHIDLSQDGAGQVTIAAGAGVTINSTPTLKFRTQYSGATLVKKATNTWGLYGDLASS